MSKRELIIKGTHRGVWYEDGALKRVLEEGRYVIPRAINLGFWRQPRVEVALVDVRERDLTIKGQEILTADKVALRVSILVQFQVSNPVAALHRVYNYEERLYSDVQLAARRSLASTTLEELLTNRNRLSEDILRDVKEIAGSYGVAIIRADVKDLVFPGNLQEIMNRVLAAERMSQVQLVEARTKADIQRLEAQARAEVERAEAQARAEARRLAAEAESEAERIHTEAAVRSLREREQAAGAYEAHPALLRLEELAALQALGQNARAHLFIDLEGTTAEPRSSRLRDALDGLKRSILGGSRSGESEGEPAKKKG
jgi:regulator of protease activity HflC (stomatin/prohibitin superfamily)